MNARRDRRRARADIINESQAKATPTEGEDGSPSPRPPRRRRPLGISLLPVLVLLIGGALIGGAYATRLAPGERDADTSQRRFAVTVPDRQQGAINSWPRFFACYGLTDEAIVTETLRANETATGSLDFPGPRVAVVLPAGDPSARTEPPGDDIIAVLQQVRREASTRSPETCGEERAVAVPDAPPADGNAASPVPMPPAGNQAR